MEINGKILELAAHGRAEIEAQERAEKERLFVEMCRKKDAWQDLQDEVRKAFPDELREFVFIAGANDDTPAQWPNGNSKTEYPVIKIPGFAPIRCFVEKQDGGGYLQTGQPNNDFKTRGAMYCIPRAEYDYENGVIWSWRYSEFETNHLDRALGYAQQQGEIYRQREAELREKAETSNPVEPVYTTMEVSDESPTTLMDELVNLIRDVVREEIVG